MPCTNSHSLTLILFCKKKFFKFNVTFLACQINVQIFNLINLIFFFSMQRKPIEKKISKKKAIDKKLSKL